MQNFPNEKQIGRTWPILLSLRAYLIDVKTNRFACCLRPKPLKIRESRTPWSHTSLHHFWHPSLGELLFRFHPFYLLLLLATIYVVWFYLVALIFILTAFSIVSPWCTARQRSRISRGTPPGSTEGTEETCSWWMGTRKSGAPAALFMQDFRDHLPCIYIFLVGW